MLKNPLFVTVVYRKHTVPVFAYTPFNMRVEGVCNNTYRRQQVAVAMNNNNELWTPALLQLF